MTSKIAVIMSIIAVIILTSEAASITRPGVPPIFEDICPTLGSEQYEVTVIELDSTRIGGLAFMEPATESIKKSFSIWITDMHHGKLTEQGLIQFRFPCQLESILPSKDSVNGKKYVHWHGHMISKKPSQKLRCALIEMTEGRITPFRIAISENSSCSGLLDLMSQPQSKMPEKIILMQLIKASESPESSQLRLRR